MSKDVASLEKTSLPSTANHSSASEFQQLRFKAEVLKEKAKLSVEKVAIARKNAEIAEKIHQIKTKKALQIVFEATEIVHNEGGNLGSTKELLAVISDIRKQQYVEAAFAAVEAADAQHAADVFESVSTKLVAAAKIVEEAADNDETTVVNEVERAEKMALAESLLVAVAEEESVDLSSPIHNEDEVEATLVDKEREHAEAIERVKTTAEDLLKKKR